MGRSKKAKTVEEIDTPSEELLLEALRVLVSWIKYDSYINSENNLEEFPEKYAIHLRPLQKTIKEMELNSKKVNYTLMVQELLERAYKYQFSEVLVESICELEYPNESPKTIDREKVLDAYIKRLSSLFSTTRKNEELVHKIIDNPFIEISSADKLPRKVRKSTQKRDGASGGAKSFADKNTAQLLDLGGPKKVDVVKGMLGDQLSKQFCPIALKWLPEKHEISSIFQGEPLVYSDREKELLDSLQDVLNCMKSETKVTHLISIGKRLVEHKIKQSGLDL